MGEVNFTPIAPVLAETGKTVTYRLNKEQASQINMCNIDLQGKNKIFLQRPKENKDGSFILGVTGILKQAGDNIQIRTYCAFDGKNITQTGGISKMGLGNIPDDSIYYKCDVKPDGYTCHNTSTDETPYFENGKIVQSSDKSFIPIQSQ